MVPLAMTGIHPFDQVSRRALLQAAAGGAPAACASQSPRHAEPSHLPSLLDRTGVALFTVREQMKADPAGTLRAIAGLGYRYVEGDMSSSLGAAAEVAGLRRASAYAPTYLVTGNRAAWTHPGGPELLPEDYTWLNAVDDAKAQGLEYPVVVYLQKSERGGLDVYRDLSQKLARAGETCRKAGLGLAYHPHCFEYEVLDGARPIDVLLGETPRELLHLELDAFWASVGGVDPVKMLEANADRVPLVHLKDKAAGVAVQYDVQEVPPAAFKEIGQGSIPCASTSFLGKSALSGHLLQHFSKNFAPTGLRLDLSSAIEEPDRTHPRGR